VGRQSIFFQGLDIAVMTTESMPIGFSQPTPLLKYDRLSAQIGVSLWVKHDDLFLLAGGGNKARKLQHILAEGIRQGCDALVTTGSSHSNHVRAAALMAARLGWRAKLVIHDKPQKRLEGNLLLAGIAGAEISFCERKDVSQRMDEAMTALTDEGRNPLYIWGGGHCLAGGLAYYEAVSELVAQARNLYCRPDFLFVASGTGTTLAGLHVGCSKLLNEARVVGVSVAHDKERGQANVSSSINELATSLELAGTANDVMFDDRFLCGGYAQSSQSLHELIGWAASTEGLILDPIYTGKAFQCLVELVKSGFVPKGATVVFWHTGGLINFLTSGMQGDRF